MITATAWPAQTGLFEFYLAAILRQFLLVRQRVVPALCELREMNRDHLILRRRKMRLKNRSRRRRRKYRNDKQGQMS